MSKKQPPQIAVTVDTEEEGLWGGGFPVSNNTTHNLRGLDRFQAACEELGVPPTYLIDAPVLEDHAAIRSLASWQNAGLCEVGAHCHPWCNPPLYHPSVTARESFLHNLTEEQQEQKLAWITERIAAAIGRAPTSFRAGRYGFHYPMATILARLGYLTDSSVLPLFDYSDESGPNFMDANPLPELLNHDGQTIVELPVTTGFTKSGFRFRKSLWRILRRRPLAPFRLAGIADRLGLARRVKLTPEGTESADLESLISSVIAEGNMTLVLMLHSSSLLAGHSPYAKSTSEVDALYERLRVAVRVATDRYGCQPVTLTNASEQLRSFLK